MKAIDKMNKKAQNFSEYALILGVVTIALIALQPYFKRGLQGIIKVTADDLGSLATEEHKTAYDQTVPSQRLGVMSTGLVNYEIKEPLQIKTEKDIKTTDYAVPGSDLYRTVNTVKDTSETNGKWTTSTVSYNPVDDVSGTTKTTGQTSTPSQGGAVPDGG